MHLQSRRRVPAPLHSLVVAMAVTAAVPGCGRQGSDGAGAADPGDTELAPLPAAYVAVQDKLAHDDIDELDVLAAKLVEALEPVAGEPGADTMLAAAGRVGAKDIDTARAAFRKLSHGILEYLRAHPEQQTGLIVIHCPMTFDGEGAPWVQVDGPVMNPYEGSMMLHCGNPADFSWTPDDAKSR